MPITKRGSFTDFDDSDSVSVGSSLSHESGNASNRSRKSNASTTGSTSGGSSTNNDALGLEEKDNCAIRVSRVLFFFVLLLAAGFLGWAVYRGARNNEVEDFETKFEGLANELFRSSEENVQRSILGLKSLSTTLTMFMNYKSEEALLSETTTSSNPPGFVTLPDVEQQFASIRNVTGALIIAYMPLVEGEDLAAWGNYSDIHQGWISKSNGNVEVNPILPQIWKYPDDERRNRRDLSAELGGIDCEEAHRRLADAEEEDPRVPVTGDEGPFAPVWMLSPPPYPEGTDIMNFDLFEKPVFQKAVNFIKHTREATFLDVCNQAKWFGNRNHADELQTVIAYPVFDSFDESGSNIVGHLTAIIPWRIFFEDILHEDERSNTVMIVLNNTCNEKFTLEVTAREAVVLSQDEDVHDEYYNYLRMHQKFAEATNPDDQSLGEHCVYTINAYPTSEFEDSHLTNQPGRSALLVLCVVLSTILFFLLFDYLVHKRQARVITMAMKNNAIVSSLFPKNIQAKMLEEVDTANRLSKVGKAGIKSYLMDAVQEDGPKLDKSKPIADLFPETTIMFADIAGFTAWSSTRDPSNVFVLLETIYHFFDATAKRRKVFKVETIGDCYVAVCGLPDPRKDHAVVMAKFAHECLRGMDDMTRDLEVELGPETTELRLRVGLHSGSVVAGVLRGEKSRFQLFGDTMNTASRMESTGVPGRIQVSQETAEKLVVAGKTKWLLPREDKVEAKGKGELSTHWLIIGGSRSTDGRSVCSSDGMSIDSGKTGDFVSLESFELRGFGESENSRISRWTVETLAILLKEIEARRRANDSVLMVKGIEEARRRANRDKKRDIHFEPLHQDGEDWDLKLMESNRKKGSTVIDEVEEIIVLPEFNADVAKKEMELDAIELSQDVMDELRHYVLTIASMYNNNPFHNFAHANHVSMSVTKLLSRIQAPDVEQLEEGANNKSLHDHTYGITSDPLTRFAVVLSALIHDVDHEGVSNMQLVKEGTDASKYYNGKSVAEQNSVDLAWNLLMESRYKNLRHQIYRTQDELNRFRQLVVNTVMATDIMDKDLKKLRNDRWDKAFSIPPEEEKKDPRAVNRKATIVIEHLIQASDVAHTMQHWHVYRKWNQRLFQEMYKAFLEGRLEKDPSVDWYKGEIGFFDFYIIPLAKKLADCGVFGVSSQEYLSYAEQNRKEWENRGQDMVSEMVVDVKRKHVGDVLYSIQQDNVDVEGEKAVKEILEAKVQRRASMLKEGVPLEVSTREVYTGSNGKETNTALESKTEGYDDLSVNEGDFEIPIKN